jgi:arsenate reductase-like glutaredoxin family protein
VKGHRLRHLEYLKTPPDRATLERFLDLLPDPPADLVRKDKRFKELGLDPADYVTRQQVVAVLLAHPELMQRPIVVRGRRAVSRVRRRRSPTSSMTRPRAEHAPLPTRTRPGEVSAETDRSARGTVEKPCWVCVALCSDRQNRPKRRSMSVPQLAPEDESWKSDPWLTSTRLSTSAPIRIRTSAAVHDPGQRNADRVFRLTRYDDVADAQGSAVGVRMADGSVFGVNLPGGPSEFILRQDPPDHTRLRKLMNMAFRPRAVEALRERVVKLVDELLDQAAARGEMDVIADLALPVPSTVICEMMGVPLADRDQFTDWTARRRISWPRPWPLRCARAWIGRRGLLADTSTTHRERRETDGDILSDLIRAEEAATAEPASWYHIDRPPDRRLRNHDRPDRQRRAGAHPPSGPARQAAGATGADRTSRRGMSTLRWTDPTDDPRDA